MTDKLESLNPATGDVVGIYPIDDAAAVEGLMDEASYREWVATL